MTGVRDFLLYRWKVEWAFDQVAATLRDHPVVCALIFGEGLLLGFLVTVTV